MATFISNTDKSFDKYREPNDNDDDDDYPSDDGDDDSIEIPIYLRIQIIGCVDKELITGYLSKEKYRGKRGKRFYGHFRCKNCGNKWKSGNTWQGYKQECKDCGFANWPFKVYHLEQSENKDMQEPHRADLCEKCQELGYNCRADDTIGGLRYSKPNKFYDQGFKKQFELLSFDIKLEIKFIQGFYQLLLPILLVNREEMNEFNEALIFCIKEWEKKGNSKMVEAFKNIFEKQFALYQTNNTLEPKFINEFYEIMWPSFSIEKKKAFKIALKSIMEKWKEHDNKEMVKACRNVLKKIETTNDTSKSKTPIIVIPIII